MQSAEKIKEGMRNCIKGKKIGDICVSEIATAGGVSRSTFYRLFDTPTDVLEYMCDTFAEELVRKIKRLAKSERHRASFHFLKFWMEHDEIIEDIFRSGRPGIFQKSFEKYSCMYMPERAEFLNSEQGEYIKASFGAVLGSILYVWIRHGKKESPEQLFELYSNFRMED